MSAIACLVDVPGSEDLVVVLPEPGTSVDAVFYAYVQFEEAQLRKMHDQAILEMFGDQCIESVAPTLIEDTSKPIRNLEFFGPG